MSYRMHPKQIENIFSLTPKQRYEHFVSKVCDWEELWMKINMQIILSLRPKKI